MHAPLVGAKNFTVPLATISHFDIVGKKFSDLKIAKPLRGRGVGAAIGEIESEGNHEIDDFNVPCMRENHSHSTSLPTISQVDIVANLEAQGEVA